MPNNVEISIIAKDLASSILDLLKNKFMELGTTTGAVAAGALVLGAAVATGLEKATEAAQSYDQEIYRMMLATGGTADATSRLVDVADKAGIGYDTLKTAMRFAVKNGIEPNIESLAKLSDEYLKLAPGVERGQFLLDKFGRSGMEMGRFMDLGRSALLKMNSEVGKSLILTKENIAASEEYRKSIVELNDTWEGFKVTIGNAVIPVINENTRAIIKNKEAGEEAIRVYGDMGIIQNRINTMTVFNSNALRDADSARMNGLASLYATKDANNGVYLSEKELARMTKEGQKAYEDAQKAFEKYNKSEIDGILNVTQINKDFKAEYKSIASDMNLTDDERKAKINELIAKNEERKNKALLDMSLEAIAMSDGVAGFSQAEKEKAMALAETVGAAEGAAIREQLAMQDTAKAVADGTLSVQNFKAAWDLIQSKGVTLQVAIDILASQGSGGGSGLVGKLGGGVMHGHATGGSFMIPQSYGNEGFRMGNGDTASAGEIVNISPKGTKSMSGGSFTFVYSPMFSLGNKQEAENIMAPIIASTVRRMQVDGRI